MSKQYLGDGVYVDFDGYNFNVTTENGVETTNSVWLEPPVLDRLLEYVTHIREAEGRER